MMERIPVDESLVVAVDFETFYAKDYSLRDIPTWSYVHDPRFDAYLVSIAGPGDFLWVGHPSKFDWSRLDGKIVVAHNLGFDGLVLKRLQELGTISEIHPAEMHCTADMAAYFKLPRALKDIAEFVFKLPDVARTGRSVRDRMKGIPADRLMDDPEVAKYAANDALLCRRLWLEWSENWPEVERKVSRYAREGGWRGVKIDMAYVDDCAARLQERMFEAARAIPWDWDPERTPLARKKMIEQAQKEVDERRPLAPTEVAALEAVFGPGMADCDGNDPEAVSKALNDLWGSPEGRQYPCRIEGGQLVRYIWYPASFAKNDEDCEAWEDQYAERPGFEWVRAVRDWRRYNMLLQKFQHLQKFTSPDGRYRVQLKYFGGHTGRWSGAGFFNVQNLPRGEMFCLKDADGKPVKGTGFDLRRCLKGPFYVTDYNQIEARGLLALVGDERILPKLREGMSVYQAHAEATMGRTWESLKDDDVPLYQQKKMEVLLLGFGGGGKKLARAAYLMTKDDPRPEAVIRWTPAQAQVVVDAFRDHHRDYICKLWARLQKKIEQAADARKELMIIRLPSGRPMYYWNVRRRTVKVVQHTDEGDKLVERTDVFSQNAKGDPSSYRKLYGGLATENCVAAGTLVLTDSGWKPIEEVAVTDKIHDGIDFVAHGGTVFKSVQPCVVVDGVKMTEDHRVLTNEGWKTALEKPRPLRPNLRGADCREADGKRREKNEVGVSVLLRKFGRESRSLRYEGTAPRRNSELRLSPRPADTGADNDARHEQAPCVLGMEVDAGSVPPPDPSILEKIWRTRNLGVREMGRVVRKLLGRHGGRIPERTGPGSHKQQRRVQQRELPLDEPEGKRPQYAAKPDSGVGNRSSRRSSHSEIDAELSSGSRVGRGAGLHGATGPGERIPRAETGATGVGPSKIAGVRDTRHDVLPTVPERLAAGKGVLDSSGAEQQVFDVVDCGPRHRFVVKGASGPFIVHNCDQAMCRDVLRDGWIALVESGYDVAFTSHDEYVVELKPGQTGEEVDRLLLETGNNSWAKFIPLGLDGKLVDYYTK